MFKKIISLALSVVFSFQACGFAQVAQLNLAGYLGQGSNSISLDRFRPASLRYFSYQPKTDNFRILLDKADEKGLSDIQVKEKADQLMKYFRIGLSLPNEKFWVNLRPDAPEQIIDPQLEQTDIGKIMLEADLQLKKDTARFTSPQTIEGRQYWDKLYKKAGELFGTENITIPTITRPWIVPGEIIVRESGDSAYIYKAALKVMLEEDYLKSPQPSDPNYQPLTSNYNFSDPRLKELNQYSTQLIRETIIPKLTKEINRAKRYAALRQVFCSLVLSRWFKTRYRSQMTENREQRTEKANNYLSLIDSGNLSNLSSKQAWDKTTYFKAYQKSFKEGEYNLSEPVYTPTGQVIRRYMSGGTEFTSSALTIGNHYKAVSVEEIPSSVNAVSFIYSSGGNPVAIAAASPLIDVQLKKDFMDALVMFTRTIELIRNKASSESLMIAEPLSENVLEMKRVINEFYIGGEISKEQFVALIKKIQKYLVERLEFYNPIQKERRMEWMQPTVSLAQEAIGAIEPYMKQLDEFTKKADTAGLLLEELKDKIIRMLVKDFRGQMMMGGQDISNRIHKAETTVSLKVVFDEIIKSIDETNKSGSEKFQMQINELKEFSARLLILHKLEMIYGDLKAQSNVLSAVIKKLPSLKENEIKPTLDALFELNKAVTNNIENREKDIADSLNKSGSPLTKAEVIKIINHIILLLKNRVAPNENFLKRIELAASNEEIGWLLERLIHINDDFMDALEALQRKISEPMEIDHLSPRQFDEQLKTVLNINVLGKVLVVGPNDNPNLIAMAEVVKESYAKLSEEKQPDKSKSLFILEWINLEWSDNIKIFEQEMAKADLILTNWDIAGNIVKQFEFNVILSDGKRIILKKIPSSIPGQEAQGEDSPASSALTLNEAKNAITKILKNTDFSIINGTDKWALRKLDIMGKSFEELYDVLGWILSDSSGIPDESKQKLEIALNSLKLGILADELKKQDVTAGGVELNLDGDQSGEIIINDVRLKVEIEFSPPDGIKILLSQLKGDQYVTFGAFFLPYRGDPYLGAEYQRDIIVYRLDNKKEFSSEDIKELARGIAKALGISGASSALEEKEINAKKAELEGIIETVFEKLEKTYGLKKAVWIGLLDRADSLPAVKKICDDIIEWIGEKKLEIDKQSLQSLNDFSGSLREIIIEKSPNPLTGVSVATDEIKEKLNNLEQYLPEAEEAMWEFGKFLSNRLNPKIKPLGFILAAQLAIYDLQGKTDAHAKQPIRSSLIGQPKLVYDLLDKCIPIIAEAVAPNKEFSDAVKKSYESMFGASSSLTKQVGGIDFRQMNMLIQPMGSFSGLDFSPARLSSSALEAMDLDKEIQGITQMAIGNMLPSPQRLKEYISACILKGKIGEKADDFVLSMLEVFQLQAEEGVESAPEEREAVVMADTRGYVLPEKGKDG